MTMLMMTSDDLPVPPLPETGPARKPCPRGVTAVDRHVGLRMMRRRQDLKLSQDYVAIRLGISHQNYNRYENGKCRISATRLFEVAQILQVELPYFFDGLPPLLGD